MMRLKFICIEIAVKLMTTQILLKKCFQMKPAKLRSSELPPNQDAFHRQLDEFIEIIEILMHRRSR